MSLPVEDIRKVLEASYDRRNWQVLLHDLFPAGNYLSDPHEVELPQSELATLAFELGSIELEGGLRIGLFEVQLEPQVKIERNRVGLRQLLKHIMQQMPGALVVFIQGDKWRLSYVAQKLTKNEQGQLEAVQTAPKRFTYLLGKGESALTAAQRFAHLKNLAEETLFKQPTLEAFEEAFNVEKLTREFFKGYKEHYEQFVAHLLDTQGYRTTIFKANSKVIRDFAKKLLGRIVFLYFLQKKGWLGVPEGKKWGEGDLHFLQNLFQRTTNKELFYSQILVELFFDTLNSGRKDYLAKQEITAAYGQSIQIPYLNGGLFENDDLHTDTINFPARLFENLFAFFGQYNFTVYEDSPEDHTVAVDPEMLGRIFESLLEEHRNKKMGIFYTPKQIVHYMSRESLFEYLRTKAPQLEEEVLRQLIEDHEAPGLAKKDAQQLDKLLENVKICDPAIGSGAFPMGLLHEIFHVRHALHQIVQPNAEFEAAEVKKQVIERSIFGVDIESGAVDIAQLRFWLALVVDEDEPRELPNLDYKIVTGDSLITRFNGQPLQLDWQVKLEGDTLNETTLKAQNLQFNLNRKLEKLYRKQLQYFDYHGDKHKMQLEIRQLKIEIVAAQVKLNRFEFAHKNDFQESMVFEPETDYGKNALAKTSNEIRLAEFDELIARLDALEADPKKPLHFFDWQIDFAYITNPEVATEEPGFDIVIGNPPYVQIQKMEEQLKTELGKGGFTTFSKSTDLYCLFYEMGVARLLKENGVLCYITSNSWLRTKYGSALRDFFTKAANPLKLVNLEDTQMFETAIVETNIILVQKAPWDGQLQAVTLPADYDADLALSTALQPHWQQLTELNADGWTIGTEADSRLRLQMEQASKRLADEYWSVEIKRGVTTGYNPAFILDSTAKEKIIKKGPNSSEWIRPLLRGRDVQRYTVSAQDLWLLFIPWHFPLQNDSSISGASVEAEAELINKFPSIYEHLKGHEAKLRARNQSETGVRYEWYVLQRWAADCYRNFAKPKIVWGELSDRPKFSYNSEDIMAEATLFTLIGQRLKYLLAFMNSKPAEWYFNQISTSSGMGTNRWKKYKLLTFPVPPPPNDEIEQKVETLVNYVLYLRETANNDLLDHTSNERVAITIEEVIDMVVFELYFTEHMLEKKIDVLQFLQPTTISDKGSKKDRATMLAFYKWLQQPENPVRQRIIKANIVSEDVVGVIKSQTR